jgi:thiol-disulfide isomerase/thioredoxin
MNKNALYSRIIILAIITSSLSGLFIFTDIYSETHTRIVSVTCLSCIKLDPKTSTDFIFKTANGKPHPDFVLKNLTQGPVFIAYRKDVCTYCDEMESLIMDVFNLSFEKEEVFAKKINFDGDNFTFIHINRDHSSNILSESLSVYDKDNINGVPMFTLITINYDHDGIVKPYYSTFYSKVGLDTDEEIKDFLKDIISDGIDLYNDNIAGYIQ